MRKKYLCLIIIIVLIFSCNIVVSAEAPSTESHSTSETVEHENTEKEPVPEQQEEPVNNSEETEEKTEDNVQNQDNVDNERNPENQIEEENEVPQTETEEETTVSQNAAKAVLPSVTELKAISAGKNRIQLSWNPVEGAEEYIIYRQIGNGKFSYLYVTPNHTYLDTSASGVEYNFYRVYPSYKTTDGKRVTGVSDQYVYAKAVLSAISNLKAGSAGKNRVKLTWGSVTGAEGYIIYRQIGKGTFTYRYITGNLSYVDMTASGSEYNYYRVYPYYKQDGKNVVGASNKYVYAKGILPAVTGLKATGQAGSVKLSWNKLTDAVGYLIYRKTETGEYKYRSMTSGTQFIDNTASQKEMNFYWVFPYFKENGQLIPGKSAKYVYAKGMPPINYGLYDSIIKKYIKAMSEKWDGSMYMNNNLCYLCTYDTSLSDVGYAIMDLDNNGVKELIISSSKYSKYYKGLIYDLYTIKEGKAVQILSSAERDRYYLCKNNKLSEEGSGSAILSFWCFYTLKNGSELSVIEGVTYDGFYDSKNPWFYVKSGDFVPSEYIPMSESKGRKIIDSYEHKEITLIPLSKY